ncbi:hypothetical protein ElyMa_006176400 [Elysia marginata]|uniref:Uncharacterized protein n=1 Tax=Elysia marginata TaxID=1093978 RepID=A0AAV4H249_9GAST|nr:hypothetical protein ElyMa_006176400 [Elysia marginata]
MGIFDEMENFIIDHFSVTKRHNVQQTIEITNTGAGRQRSEQTSSGQVSRSGPGGQQVSQQVVSLTHQGQVATEHLPSSAVRVPSSGSASVSSSPITGDRPNWTEARVRSDDRRHPPAALENLSQPPTSHRPQHAERDATQTSPFFRELLSWGERTSNTMGLTEQQRSTQTSENESHGSPHIERAPFRSPQLERICFRSPQLDRFRVPSSPVRTHRTSWIEQSSMSSRSPGARRSYSLEQVASPPGLRRTARQATSTEHARNSQCEALPPTPPLRQEREVQRTTPQSENLPPNSPFRTERPRLPSAPLIPHGRSSPTASCTLHLVNEARSPQSENQINAAISGESPPSPRLPQSCSSTLISVSSMGNLQDPSAAGITIRTVSKPKLVRLRSEPCSPSFTTGNEDINCCSAHSAGVGRQGATDSRISRRRREELKRSQSFEARSPSCQEALWMGINMPSQVVITRPQLCRARLNRKHLSLHLEGKPDHAFTLNANFIFHETANSALPTNSIVVISVARGDQAFANIFGNMPKTLAYLKYQANQ